MNSDKPFRKFVTRKEIVLMLVAYNTAQLTNSATIAYINYAILIVWAVMIALRTIAFYVVDRYGNLPG